jgi:ribonucleotide reductase alpha subunit
MPIRTLTLLVEIDENNKPSWIWDSHSKGEFINGVYVSCIGEGDQFKDVEDWE